MGGGCCSPREDEKRSSCCAPKEEKRSSCCSTEPKAEKIHADMTIEAIISCFPHKAQKLKHEITSVGLHCVGCHSASAETLRAGMFSHGMTQEQVDHLVDRLNALLEEESDPDTITLTPKAAAKYMQILEEDNKQGWGLRFGEILKGCNGFEYELDYSEKASQDDTVFESQGIQIHVNNRVVKRLLGSEIDYVDGVNFQSSGFKVTNPNARSSCGCGTSHNY